MKTALMCCVFAVCSLADVILLTGVVTSVEFHSQDIPGLPPVQVGDTYQAWVGFEVWNSITRQPWEPQAIRLFCGMSGYCSSDLSGHSTYFGGVGVTYSNGFHDSTLSWGDGGLIELDDNLNVLVLGTSSAFGFIYERSSPWLDAKIFRHTYSAGSSYWRINSTADDYPIYAQIPEPSAFLLAAPALLFGFWLRRRHV